MTRTGFFGLDDYDVRFLIDRPS